MTLSPFLPFAFALFLFSCWRRRLEVFHLIESVDFPLVESMPGWATLVMLSVWLSLIVCFLNLVLAWATPHSLFNQKCLFSRGGTESRLSYACDAFLFDFISLFAFCICTVFFVPVLAWAAQAFLFNWKCSFSRGVDAGWAARVALFVTPCSPFEIAQFSFWCWRGRFEIFMQVEVSIFSLWPSSTPSQSTFIFQMQICAYQEKSFLMSGFWIPAGHS